MFVDFNILNQLGSPSINSNTFANRPAAGQTGRLFVSTDTFEIYRDNGTTWDLIGGPGTSTITGTGTATQVAYFTSSQAIGSSANLFWDNTAGALGINTATPGAELDIHGTGVIVQVNSTSATANSLLAFQRSGNGVWRIGDQYNGGSNFFELHNTVLTNNAIQVLASSNEATFLSSKTYSSGNAIGVAVQHNLTIPNGVNVGLAAIGGVNSNLNLTLGGSTTVAATGRQGLEGSTTINFTGAGTLTMTQGSTVRAFSALSSVYAFNGSAIGTITHLAGLRICFPDNVGSAVNITNNYALLINNQTTGTGTVTYTNRWGIYQEGISDLNYMAANLLLGSTVNSGEKLQVTGTAIVSSTMTAGSFIPTGNTIPTNGMYLSNTNEISFATNSAQIINVNGSGNTGMGIGGTTPASRLHISGDFTQQTSLNIAGQFWIISRKSRGTVAAPTTVLVNDDAGGILFSGYDGATWRSGAAISAQVQAVTVGTLSSNLRFYAGNGSASAATLRATFRGDTGNFLLNQTTDTGERLQVTGTAIVSSTMTAASFIPTGNTIPTNGMYLSAANEISFATNSTQIINVNGSGNTGMGIGGTTPASRLHISGDFTQQTSLNIAGQFFIIARKSRGTVASPTTVLVNDDAGGILFSGYDGATWRSGAGIRAQVQAVTVGTLSSNLGFFAGNGSISGATHVLTMRGDTKNVLIGSTTDTGEKLQVTGTVKTTDSITTGTPNGGTAGAWKFGSRVAAAVALDATQYIELDIGGTLYKLAIVI